MTLLPLRQAGDTDHRAHRNGQITKADLLEMRRSIEDSTKRDRHEIYNKIQRLGAELELDMKRVEDNVAQYVKSNEARMREVELELARRSGGRQK